MIPFSNHILFHSLSEKNNPFVYCAIEFSNLYATSVHRSHEPSLNNCATGLDVLYAEGRVFATGYGSRNIRYFG